MIRKVYIFQRGNDKPLIEGQTIQWPNKMSKGQTIIHKPTNRTQKIEQHEPHFKPRDPEWSVVPAPHVPHVMLLLNVMNII
jgi:hypothetical protein